MTLLAATAMRNASASSYGMTRHAVAPKRGFLLTKSGFVSPKRKRFGVAGPLSVTAAAGDLAANKLYQYREGFADKYLEANWRSRFHQDVIQLLTPDADIDLCAPGGLDIAKISHRDNGLSELWSEIVSDLSRDMRDSRVATFKKSDTKFADNQLALQCC